MAENLPSVSSCRSFSYTVITLMFGYNEPLLFINPKVWESYFWLLIQVFEICWLNDKQSSLILVYILCSGMIVTTVRVTMICMFLLLFFFFYLFIPHHPIMAGYYGFTLDVRVSVRLSICRLSVRFSFPDDNLSWFSPNLVCALILWRPGLGVNCPWHAHIFIHLSK